MLISKLPKWVLVEKFPAFFDTESLTAVEQTARLYGKVNELIDSYNKYVEEINTAINDFEIEKNKEIEGFICRLSCLTDNYINTVDMKIAHQNRQIAEMYTQFKDDVINTLKLLISDLKESGELDQAIYEALDNIHTKVDNFIADMTKKQAQLEVDYTAKKDSLEADYQTVKTNLATDYSNTKTQLEADYQTTKNSLATDYSDTKTQLEADFTEKKTALETSVEGYTDMYDNKGVRLYDNGVNGNIPNGTPESEHIINGLENYTILNVVLAGCGATLCHVIESEETDSEGNTTPIYAINGTGSGVLTTAGTVYISAVNIRVEKATGKVLTNNSSMLIVAGTSENGMFQTAAAQIGSIAGII